MGGVHVAVAYYDLQALDFVSGVFNPERRVGRRRQRRRRHVDAGRDARPDRALRSRRSTPSASALPAEAPTLQPWDGTSRLNILLIGSDQRPKESSYNTDTLIVAEHRPDHPPGRDVQPPARHVRGSRSRRSRPGPSSGSVYPGKINSLFQQARARPDLFPGGGGYAALKQTLGDLYRIPIQYFVEVDFDRVQEGRRRARRGDDQRPDARRRRPLPRRRRARSASTSRPASST